MKIGNAAWGWTPIPEDLPQGDSLHRITSQIRELGFDAIDYLGTPEALEQYYSPKAAEDLGAYCRSLGIEPNVFVYQEGRWNSPDPETAKRTLAGFEQAADTAVRVGCHIVSTLVPIPWGASPWRFNPAAPAQKQSYRLPEDYCYQEDWNRLAEHYRQALRIAKSRGLRMSIECFVGSMISTPHAMLQILADVDDEDFGIQLDTNHLVAQQIDPEWTIRVLGGRRIFNIHCKDHDSISRGNIPAGCGITDYTAVIGALKQVGYTGNLTVELEFTDNPRRYNKQALDHIRLCLNGAY